MNPGIRWFFLQKNGFSNNFDSIFIERQRKSEETKFPNFFFNLFILNLYNIYLNPLNNATIRENRCFQIREEEV